MPKRCASFECFGNYKGQPYVSMVKFPTDVNERERWIQALPNSRGSLDQRFVLVTLTAVGLLREVVKGQLIHRQFSHKYRSQA